MANDKDFVVNGPVAVGKDTKVTVGSIAAGTVDLSTGNYFTDTPTGDYTYTFANPGDVQSFQIEATGGSEAVAETFSTTLYEGNSAEQTITNGIDLAADGGMVWGKIRSSADNHWIVDSENGIGSNGTYNYLQTNLTNGLSNFGDRSVKTFNSDGFTLANSTNDQFNLSPETYVSWTFKKQTKFFDVVTYTGAGGLTQTVSHSLGSTPGTIIVKRTDGVGNWAVYHRSTGATKYLELEDTAAAVTNSTFWYDTEPTSTQFTVGNDSSVNNSGYSYVAYLFAHDTASDGLIQCGSYTGNGSTTGPVINLGWQPQWLLTKASTRTSDWTIVDSKRGVITGGNDARLHPQSSEAEANNADIVDFLADGFQLTNTGTLNNGGGETYIYMAIRSASAPAITWPTNIEWTGGSTPSTPAEGETDVYTFTTDDGGTTYTGIQSIDNAS
jgi:hypothetical protein